MKANKNCLILFIFFNGIFVAFFSNAQSWIPIGTAGFTAGVANITSIAIDRNNIPYVAYQDATVNYGATVMKYNGSNWVTVGIPGFSAGPISVYSLIAIALDTNGTPYVVYGDGGSFGFGATVMKYTDTAWVNVGSPDFTSPNAIYPAIAIDGKGTPYVLYSDQDSNWKATVMKYNDTNWVIVGIEGFSAGEADYCSMAIDSSNTPYVVYSDCGINCKATVMKYDGSNWMNVGSPDFSAGEAGFTTIAIDRNGTPYVAYTDVADSSKATVMKYNGSSWIPVGNAGFSAGEATWTSIAINKNDMPYVTYSDSINHWTATVMQPDTSEVGIKSISNTTNAFSVFPNPNCGSFTLNVSSALNEQATVVVTDIMGERIKEWVQQTNIPTIVKIESGAGVYFLTAITGQSRLCEKVIVI